MKHYDFCGWATKNNIKCSDGRTILEDAFKDCDGMVVPLVWNHDHGEPENVLGHALLENRKEGVYTYGSFNDTEMGLTAKSLVDHGDITSLSIYANHLKQNGKNVLHGMIREVSLVLAGANPGARIDAVSVEHSEDNSDLVKEAIIYSGLELSLDEMEHSEEKAESEEKNSSENKSIEENKDEIKDENKESKEEEKVPALEHSEENQNDNKIEVNKMEKERTVKDVYDEMNDEQKAVVEFFVDKAVEEVEKSKEGDKKVMKHNAFENEKETNGNELSHSDVEAIFNDAKRYGSLKESALQHGITNIDFMFPDNKSVTPTPRLIKREDSWVSVVLDGVNRTPFSKVKSLAANLTTAEARALGYIKGNLKTDEVIELLKRETNPTTIYKKQKIDRDDMVDITDFDIVAWIKSEMRMMLDEEAARAILVGDGRSTASSDHISTSNVRPIWTDDDLYTVKVPVEITGTPTDEQKAKAFIRAAIKNRKLFKGTANPVMFVTEDVLSSCLLIEDRNQRVIYEDVNKLATALRVSKVISVPVMENKTRSTDTHNFELMGIMVALKDYNVGATRQGQVSLFDDFDIDYNAQKYLIETRFSGALVQPYGAMAFEYKTAISPEPSEDEEEEDVPVEA